MLLLSANSIHSLLFLVLVFLLTTCVFLLLRIDFLSMLFLVVYLGAIIVLFLFVVMMLNIRVVRLNEKIITYIPIILFIFFGIFLELLKMLKDTFIVRKQYLWSDFYNIVIFREKNWIDHFNILTNIIEPKNMFNMYYNNIYPITNLETVGIMLYAEFLHIVIIGSIILLLGMIGPILLTLQNQLRTKHQNYYKQNSKNIFKSIKKIK